MNTKVLILPVYPKITSYPWFNEKFCRIEHGLQHLKYGDKITIFPIKMAVSVKDIHQMVLEYEPQIVHFCGYKKDEYLHQEMVGIEQAITRFLISLPNLHESDMQRTILYGSGLDDQLKDLVRIGGSPIEFVQLLLSSLNNYGTLKDGRHAVVAFLESTKQYVGQDKQAICNRLIQKFQMVIDPRAYQINTAGERIFLEDEEGNVSLVNSKKLSELFECSRQIECVLLDSCYSEIQVKSINNYVKYVIGLREEIHDKNAINFAINFYSNIGTGTSIEEAFRYSCETLKLDKIPKDLFPILSKKQNLHEETAIKKDNVIVKCPTGLHLYDSSKYSNCPYCNKILTSCLRFENDNLNPKREGNMVRCSTGLHLYDSSRYTKCPYCENIAL